MRFAGSVLWASAAILLSATAATAAEAPRALPIFDVHVHYNEIDQLSVSPAQALELLDRAGVRVALVSSTPDGQTLELLAAAPGRIVAELRPYRDPGLEKSWLHDKSVIPYLGERLANGVRYKGIGEFHALGDEAALPVMAAVVDLAAARDLVLHAHSDVAALGHLFARAPRARVLWAHAGYADAAAVRRMLERHPTLWADTSMRPDIAEDGVLHAEWRRLIVDHPGRFMVGSDTYVTRRWFALPQIIGDIRAWLQTLPPEVAEQVAWRNAARLFDVDPAMFQDEAPAPLQNVSR